MKRAPTQLSTSKLKTNGLQFGLLMAILYLFYFAVSDLARQNRLTDDFLKLQKLSEYGVKAGALVHELQKEYSLSTAVSRVRGKGFREQLGEQRLLTDEKLIEFLAPIDTLKKYTDEPAILALAALQLFNDGDINEQSWWTVASKRIDLLRQLEIELSKQIIKNISQMQADANQAFSVKILLYPVVVLVIFGFIRWWLSSRRQTEYLLLKSQQRLRMALEGSSAAMWDYNVVTEDILLSKRLLKMLGMGDESIVVKIEEMNSLMSPEESIELQKMVLAHLTGQRKSFVLDHRIKHHSGHWIWVHNSGKVTQRNNEGQPLRMVGTLIDISERKLLEKKLRASEQRLKFHRQNSPLAIIEWNISFEVTFWNKAAEKTFGYSAAEAMGKHGSFIIPPEEIEKVNQIWGGLLAKSGGESSSNYNIEKSGKLILCEWNNTRLVDNRGIVVGVASIVENITQRKRTEDRLYNSQKMEALGKLTGGIAHDFNNMLGVILGYAEILGTQLQQQPKLAKFAEQIHRAGERGAKLTGKLLSFSRQRPAQENRVNINHLVEMDADLLRKTLTASIELKLKLFPAIWAVKLDINAFEDLILNMSINASHAMPGGGRFTLSSFNLTLAKTDAIKLDLPSGDYVCLSIEDSGCGISVDDQNKIFDPFFSTKGNQGTGLGLSQVYGFVRSSGGAIKVYSEPGLGTRFEIYFPREFEVTSRVNNRADSASVDETGQAETGRSFSGTETILVVDDEIPLCELAEEILVSNGYRVLTAFNAEQALHLLQSHRVDLMLSDIIMPQMNGYQLIKTVKQLYPDVLVRLASGFEGGSSVPDKDIALDEPVINKPYSSKNLLSSIRQQLDQAKFCQNPPLEPPPIVQNDKNSNAATQADNQPRVVTWTEAMNIDQNGVLDRDHQKLLALLNQCHQLSNDDEAHGPLKTVIQQLVDYTHYHFQREEVVMKACEYPHYKNHCSVHRIFINKLQSVVNTKTTAEIRDWITDFLTDWLIEHIMVMDKAYVPFMQGKEKQIEKALGIFEQQFRVTEQLVV